MDVISYLEKDHGVVLDLIEKLQKMTDEMDEVREDLFLKLREELALHEIVEERVLYPALMRADHENKDEVVHAFEEHQKVDALIEQMSEMSPKQDSWEDNLSEVKNNLQHHINEERDKLFKLAKKLFDQIALTQMTQDMQKIKDEVKS